MPRHRRIASALAALAVVGCSDDRLSPDGSDGAAIGVCRSALEGVADRERLATTVRDEGNGYRVSAWTSGQAKGVADYVCDVRRDPAAERGVVVVEIRPSHPLGRTDPAAQLPSQPTGGRAVHTGSATSGTGTCGRLWPSSAPDR